MSNSPLVEYTKISPNSDPRTKKITKITIHHAGCVASVEGMGNGFAKPSRKASSNYGIGSDGRIAMYVEECNRAWTSSNLDNDNMAITIEVSNSQAGGNWPVSDFVMGKLLDLCVDICQRNGIKRLNYTGDKNGNLTRHNMFAATTCPGPYLQERFPYIVEQVNKRLAAVEEAKKADEPKKTESNTIYRVQTGAFRNKAYADAYLAKVKAAGFSTYMVQVGGLYKVQVGAYKVKANAENMAKKLKAAGFNTFITTQSGTAVSVSKAKTVDEIAKEVIQGKWGNGTDRKNRLTKAGYNYAAVQKRVDEMLKK